MLSVFRNTFAPKTDFATCYFLPIAGGDRNDSMNLGKFLPKARRDYAAALDYWRVLEAQDEASVAEMQLSKLRVVWRDAVADVPYYGRLVREGRAPAEIVTWDDFRAIPELTREILQDRAEEFVRVSGPPDLTRMTGGSTGNPVKFGVWHSEDEVIRMLKLVLWTRTGYQLGDRIFLIWGHGHLFGTGWRRSWAYFHRKCKDAFLGYKRVDAYKLSRGWEDRYLNSMTKFAPAGLIGYSTILDQLVRSMPDKHELIAAMNLKFVMPSAEAAPRPDSFALLSKAFACPVIQEFAGLDFGQVAMKFGEDPFEVFAEYNVLEGQAEARVAGEEGTGSGNEEKPVVRCFGASVGRSGSRAQTESHEVAVNLSSVHAERGQRPEVGGRRLEVGEAAVVTALYRRYLPIIRYRQGDLIAGCIKMTHGHVQMFHSLSGRINDMFTLSDGTPVHSSVIFPAIQGERNVLNIQMIIDDSGLSILLVAPSGRDEASEDRIRERLARVSPILEEASIKWVSDVETTRAGKRRWFVDKRTEQPKVAK
jgi:phenylacetate-coenzyme A ligase PaaK-like adenylate-forming protein